MKKLFLFVIILIPFIVAAQVTIDRTKAPAPGPAPIIKIGEPAMFTLPNGLKVFVVQNTKLPRVSATLTIDRESILEGDKAGMISMAGELFRRGTAKMNKATLDEEIDYLGAAISTSASSVSGTSLKSNFPRVMNLMADIALRPSFPATELEKIRKQEISGLAQAKDDPNAIANNVASKLAYGADHPYGEIETEATAKKVSVNDIKNYYTKYWKPNIAYLIFVGDISAAEAKKLAEQNFGAWKKGVVPDVTYKTPQPPAKTFIAIVDRPVSVQSVITFITPIQLKPGAADAIPSSLMNNILGNGSSGRLYKNLRENHGFTYGAYSSVSSDRLVGNFTATASVRNEKTDSAIAEFLNEFKKIRTETVNEEDVRLMKNQMNGSFARSLESPSTIANFALNVARYNLPRDYYQKYLTNLATVTTAGVEQMANKYVQPGNMLIVIVGNAKEISKGLDKYGQVKYFDSDGNEMAAPVATKTVDASITPESILKKSIAAIGGETALAAIKDAELTGTASVMGQALKLSRKYIVGKAFVQAISMGEMTVMKQVANNGTYNVSMQGMSQELKDDDKEELDENTYLVDEVYYLKQPGYTFTVKGIEQVDGKDAYVMDIKSSKGRAFTNYYDVATSLKVKTISTEDGPTGKTIVQTYFKEYKIYNGLQVPVKVLVDQGDLKIEMVITDVKVNQGLKAEDFK